MLAECVFLYRLLVFLLGEKKNVCCALLINQIESVIKSRCKLKVMSVPITDSLPDPNPKPQPPPQTDTLAYTQILPAISSLLLLLLFSDAVSYQRVLAVGTTSSRTLIKGPFLW